jgi:hypothetical protein
MQKDTLDAVSVSRLDEKFGHALVDEAVRIALSSGRSLARPASLTGILLGSVSLLERVEHSKIIQILESLANIGKPLAPAPQIPGGQPIFGTKIGIQGNPPELDTGYSGGWHFAQDNGWDAWFTFVSVPTGGFRVANPACRITGDHGPAKRGSDSFAEVVSDPAHSFFGHISFQIHWEYGTVGPYTGRLVAGGLSGNAGGNVLFDGTRMPAHQVSDPVQNAPVISLSAVPNTQQDGFTVTVSGSGLGLKEFYEIQGRTLGSIISADWAMYSEGQCDNLGRFGATFGVIKPIGQKYVFRALGQYSGLTQEVQFS